MLNFYEFKFSVSADKWEKCKDTILSINFQADSPELIKHQPANNMVYATFKTCYHKDIYAVKAIIDNL
jgi:hypothetical protein